MPKMEKKTNPYKKNDDMLSSLTRFSKSKIVTPNDDPLFSYPKFKKKPSSVHFKSAAAPNWLNLKLSTQSDPTSIDQKEGLALTLFAIKPVKSTPTLSALIKPKIQDHETIESRSPCTI
ncbi:MAG: hypothetical protein NTU48_08950 [Legionellales bacterium]|nr:hypothetical protein [Legionellales bacterium]